MLKTDNIMKVMGNVPIYKKIKPQIIETSEYRLLVKFPILSWELNHMGTLHGGVMAIFMDFTCGLLTCHFSNNYKIPTINLNINYLNSVSITDELYVEAIADKVGSNIINLSGKAYIINEHKETEKNKNIATCTASFLLLANK